MIHLFCVMLAAALILPAPADAQALWMRLTPATPAVSQPIALTLHRGKDFAGDPIPFIGPRVAALQLYSKLAVRDLHAHLPDATPVDQLTLTFFNPGTHMLVYDSQPELIAGDALPKQGPGGAPDATWAFPEDELHTGSGMQRHRRHLKAIIGVGGKSDGTYSLLTGQRLEIVPATDPLAKAPGDTLAFTLFFDSKPLSHTAITAWHKGAGQTTLIRARSAEDGKAGFVLPFAGTWMVSAMHMIPGADPATAEWDCFWGSLTFDLAATKP